MVDKNPAARQGWTIPILVSLAIMLPQLVSLAPRSDPVTGIIGSGWLANGMIQSLSQVVLLAVIIGVSGGSREFGVHRPRAKDAAAALMVLGGMLLISRLAAMIAAIGALAPVSPSALSPEGRASPNESLSQAAILALSMGFALASAYREELFYRAYLLGSCRQRSAPPAAAVAVSLILFAWGHASQGAEGIAVAALMGLFLAIAWTRGASVHALAWGHAAYNFGILLTLNTG